MGISYVLSSIAVGVSWSLSFICILSNLFEVDTTLKQKIFYMTSSAVLVTAMLNIFYNTMVTLRTIIIIAYLFVLAVLAAKDILKALAVYVSFIITMATAELIHTILVITILEYSLITCFLANAAATFAITIILVCIKRFVKLRKIHFKRENLFLLLLTLTAVFIAAMLQLSFETIIVSGESIAENQVIGTFIEIMILMYIVAMIAAIGFVKGLREERKNKMITEQQKLLESMYNGTRIFRHNYKNTLITLQGYCDSGEYDKLSERIMELSSNMNDIYNTQQWLNVMKIEDPGIRNLLMRKIAEADQAEVNITIKILGEKYPHFESMDMINVMGVLLDNAVEAAIKSAKKELEIMLVNNDELDFLSIVNSFKDMPDINKMFDAGYSSKKDGGMGLYYVNKVLNKRDDLEVSFDCDDMYFKVKIGGGYYWR